MKDVIIIHFSEIVLKGRNKNFFYNKLKENIKKSLRGLEYEDVIFSDRRFLIYFSGKDKELFAEKLAKVFGIYHFSFAKEISVDLEEMKKACLSELENKNFSTFKVSVKRSQKNYKYNSVELGGLIGEYLLEKNPKLKVNLKNPEFTCFVEISMDKAMIFSEKILSLSGMPVGTAGKVISLLSSGIDSPVASWKMIKRGAQVVFVHFHNYPYSKKESINNVKKLVKILEQYQYFSKLYLVSLTEVQKKILKNTKPKLRIVLYRRMMIRVAEKIAFKEKALGLVTGDSLGQVASQTLENIFCVNQAATIPIFRPLIGEDKQEIMDLARKIGTYDISIQPYEDCCQMFAPKNPETKARLAQVLFEEGKLDVEKMVEEAEIDNS